MPAAIWLKSMLIGFSIAAPVGPIGVLCIRRTLAGGRIAGLLTGLGAASADAVYGALAAFGLTVVSDQLMAYSSPLRLGGGLFLILLGLKTGLTRPAESPAPLTAAGGLSHWASTFVLTLTNPITIISFAAIFSSFGISIAAQGRAGLVVAGVFTGSALWWLILTGGVGLIRDRLTPVLLAWINRAAGLIIGGFGLMAVLSFLYY